MPFVKGQSGNPSGKPGRTKEHRKFMDWCQKTAVKKVWKVLRNSLESNAGDKQQWASEIILQRAFGNPVQFNQNENYDMTPEQALSDEQLRAKAREILRKEADANDRPAAGIGSDSQNSGIPAVQ